METARKFKLLSRQDLPARNFPKESYPAAFIPFDPGPIIYVPKPSETASRTAHNNAPAWQRSRSDGSIVMGPYEASRSKTTEHLGKTEVMSLEWMWYRNSSYDPDGNQRIDYNFIEPFWMKQAEALTFREASDRFQTFDDPIDLSIDQELGEAVSSSQTEAYAASMSQYDLLTDLAELRESFSTVGQVVSQASSLISKIARTDEQAWKRGRGSKPFQLLRSSDRALRSLGSRWMLLRYGIMPLVYSVKDINEMWEKRDAKYLTTRSKRVIERTNNPPNAPANSWFIRVDRSLSITVRSTVKSMYSRGAFQRAAATTGINPLSTAWELIPLSFVVDWFLNIGDNIRAQTSVDYSTQKIGCTSVKRTTTSKWYLGGSVDYHRQIELLYYDQPAKAEYSTSLLADGLLREESTESYQRYLFSKPEARVVFEPNLNWKRFIDGLVLLHQPAVKLLRSL